MKIIITFILLCISGLANAGCIAGEPFSANKAVHMGGTALIAGFVTAKSESPWLGFGAGLAVGAVREAYKANHPGMRCEYSSMTWDVAGSALGAHLANKIYLTPTRGGVAVALSIPIQ